jgi:hypothetical protein
MNIQDKVKDQEKQYRYLAIEEDNYVEKILNCSLEQLLEDFKSNKIDPSPFINSLNDITVTWKNTLDRYDAGVVTFLDGRIPSREDISKTKELVKDSFIFIEDFKKIIDEDKKNDSNSK